MKWVLEFDIFKFFARIRPVMYQRSPSMTFHTSLCCAVNVKHTLCRPAKPLPDHSPPGCQIFGNQGDPTDDVTRLMLSCIVG